MHMCVMYLNHSSATKIQAWWCGCNFRRRKVCKPCSPTELGLNIPSLINYLKTECLTPGRLEYLASTKTGNLVLDKGWMEYIVAMYTGGKRVGEGNGKIDVVKGNIGMDVACLCMNGKGTNEKSLMQKLSGCGNNLDILFANQQYKEALYSYILECYNRMICVKKKLGITELYYCIFISTNVSVHLSILKINLDYISNLKYDDVTTQGQSIKFNGFIDDGLGATILFKSKKRLELRLDRAILDHCDTIQLI